MKCRSHGATRGRIIGVLLIVSAVAGAQQPTTSAWASRFRLAHALLAAGDLRRAEAIYRAALDSLPATDPTYTATAHFGLAATLQLQMTSGDSAASSPAEAVREYQRAMQLDPALRGVGEYNLALISRGRADHREAVAHFIAASKSSRGVQAAKAELELAREYEMLQDPAALAHYRAALELDSASNEAFRDYIRLLAVRGSVQEVLNAANRWGQDSVRALPLLPALTTLLLRDSEPPDAAQAQLALRSILTSLTASRTGLPWFQTALRDRVREIAERVPSVSGKARDLLDAYSGRPAGTLPGFDNSSWWRGSTEDRAAWSSLLRWLGDWNYAQENLSMARDFYEGAIGNWRHAPDDPAIDRKALLPLTLIYAQTDNQAGAARVERNIDLIFDAKAAAYQHDRLEDIRDFHTALGAYYAAKGQWTGTGAQNAEYQLSHMREATQQLAAQGRVLHDPPELLASLAQHYVQSGHVERAEPIKRDLTQNAHLRGNPARTDSLIKRIDQRTPIISVRPAATQAPQGNRVPSAPQPRGSPSRIGGVTASGIVIRLVDATSGALLNSHEALLQVDGREVEQPVTMGVIRLPLASGMDSVSLSVNVTGYAPSAGWKLHRGDSVDVRLTARPSQAPTRRPPT